MTDITEATLSEAMKIKTSNTSLVNSILLSPIQVQLTRT